MNPEVQRLMARAEECHRELALEYYNAYAGLQERLDVGPIFARYPELSAESTWRFISELDPSAVADERERRFLKLAFAGFYSHAQLRELTEEIANAESAATLDIAGEEVPFRALPGRIANERDYTQRGELDALYIAAIDALNPQRRRLVERTREVVQQLGFADTPTMVADLKNLDAPRFAGICREFLERSDAVYADRLAEFAHASGIDSVGAAASLPLRQAAATVVRHADIGFILRAERFDELFPPREMLPALARTLQGLGIDLAAQRNVTLDLESRPRKSPRAFCIGIDIPGDVRLVLAPRGGQDDYSVLFHEAGHMEFAAHCRADLPYFYRQHGDLSVHEGYAFLFQHLTAEPAWWREIMRADSGTGSASQQYCAFARFQRLYLFRRYCAKLNYELEFYAQEDLEGAGSHPRPATVAAASSSRTAAEMPPPPQDGNPPSIAHRYSEWLTRGCGFSYPPQRYLADFDADLYVLQYLQAWVWEVQLRAHLRERFGEAWFTSRRAGDLLRELWSEGMMYDAWELARQLGMDGLDIEPLAQELLS